MTDPVRELDEPLPLAHRPRRSAELALIQVEAPPGPPPDGAVLHPPAPHDPASRPWFLAQLWTEVRLVVRMYFDPHYRISRTAQFVLPAILVLFVLNYFFFAAWLAIPVISPVVERVVCVLLGVFFYKLMTRELSRYRNVLDYLARYSPR
jgi:hypothetical protein